LTITTDEDDGNDIDDSLAHPKNTTIKQMDRTMTMTAMMKITRAASRATTTANMGGEEEEVEGVRRAKVKKYNDMSHQSSRSFRVPPES